MMLMFTVWSIVFTIIAILLRLVMKTTTWEKLMALNIFAIKMIMLITIYAVMTENESLLDLSITYSIIGFLSVTLISRFLYFRGKKYDL